MQKDIFNERIITINGEKYKLVEEENSEKDKKEDEEKAKAAGMTPEEWEKSEADKKHDEKKEEKVVKEDKEDDEKMAKLRAMKDDGEKKETDKEEKKEDKKEESTKNRKVYTVKETVAIKQEGKTIFLDEGDQFIVLSEMDIQKPDPDAKVYQDPVSLKMDMPDVPGKEGNKDMVKKESMGEEVKK